MHPGILRCKRTGDSELDSVVVGSRRRAMIVDPDPGRETRKTRLVEGRYQGEYRQGIATEEHCRPFDWDRKGLGQACHLGRRGDASHGPPCCLITRSRAGEMGAEGRITGVSCSGGVVGRRMERIGQ